MLKKKQRRTTKEDIIKFLNGKGLIIQELKVNYPSRRVEYRTAASMSKSKKIKNILRYIFREDMKITVERKLGFGRYRHEFYSFEQIKKVYKITKRNIAERILESGIKMLPKREQNKLGRYVKDWFVLIEDLETLGLEKRKQHPALTSQSNNAGSIATTMIN